MSRVRIQTPVPDHDGVVGHVFITQGVGYADSVTHAAEIAYCLANGYTITDLADEPAAEPSVPGPDADGEDEVPMPRRSGSAEAWREYAVAHGMSAEEAQSLTRDQLVERFTSTEEDA